MLFIVFPVCAVVLSPVTFELAVATQEKVEGTSAVNAKPTEVLEQIVAVFKLVITG